MKKETLQSLFKEYKYYLGLLILFFLTQFLAFGYLAGSFYSHIYQSGIYPFVRWYLDGIFASLPFNAFFLVLIPVLLFVMIQMVIWIKNFKKKGIHLRQFSRIISVPLILSILFYWQWGFHYSAPDLTEQLQLDLKSPGEKRLMEEVRQTMESLLAMRIEMGVDTTQAISEVYEGTGEDSMLYLAGEEVFAMLGLPLYGDPKVKKLRPNGFLHRINTSGFYNPITGECNLESDLHPLQVPFVAAHEWTHAQAITDEGDANFLGFLICVHSEDAFHKYSGLLTYWRYLLSDLRRNNPDNYELVQNQVNVGIKKDLLEIKESLYKYPEFMPKMRDVVYNSYLKTHGVTDGMASYNRIVTMVITYKRERKI